MCTHQHVSELFGLLLSISIYHPGSPIIIISDSKTKYIVEQSTPQPNLQLKWIIVLNKYCHLDRDTMERAGILHDFQVFHAVAIHQALIQYPDTLFLESQMIVTGVISSIDKSKDLGISPQYTNTKSTNVTGLYNSGMLWTKNKNVPKQWAKFIQTSRYYHQAAIEDLANQYSYFCFGENYNIHMGRQNEDEPNKFIQHFGYNDRNRQVYYKNSQVKCIRMHLRDNKRFEEFNNLFCRHFQMAKMYKIIAIMFRVIHGKWILRIPDEPNYRFRELVYMIAKSNPDVCVIENSKTSHCWLAPTIMLYDKSCANNKELKQATCLFLYKDQNQNPDQDQLQVHLQTKYPSLSIYPWIFWSKHPECLEDMVTNEDTLYYDERPIETILLQPNLLQPNLLQAKENKTNQWATVIQECHCTNESGSTTYFETLGQTKFGLCVHGLEIDLMAFGTVPILTSECSYLKEDIHYIRVDRPADLRDKLNSIDKTTWETMSEACFDWYQENCMSDRVWDLTIRKLLYDHVI